MLGPDVVRVDDQGDGFDYVPFMVDGYLENPDLQEHPQVLKSPPWGTIGTTMPWKGCFRDDVRAERE